MKETTECGWPRDALLMFYQEVGQHIRAGGDLRERLAAVFLTTLAGAASLFGLVETQKPGLVLALARPAFVASLLVIVYGELVLWGVVAARVWQAEYVNSMILLQAMIRENTIEPASSLVEPAIRHKYLPGATTSRTYLLVQLGVLFAIYAASSFSSRLLVESACAYVAGACVGTVSLTINAFVTRNMLERAERRFWEDPTTSWCFAGLRRPLGGSEAKASSTAETTA